MGMGGFASPQARTEFDEVYATGMRTLPEPVAEWDVPTAFGAVRVYRFGPDGDTPIVLLPGRASTTVMWQPNLAGLAARCPVYALDLLGEPGRSTQTAPLRDGADQAAWLDTVFAELGLQRVHLVGYSFGGWLAANQVVRSPGRLASVTLLDPVNTFARFPVALLVRTALAALPVTARWARPSFLRWVAGGEPVPAGDPVAEVIDAGMRTYRMAVPAPAYLTDRQLRGIDVPLLVLVAGRSVMHHPRRAAARARRVVPDVRVELWPAATHALIGEFPAEVNARVLAFCAEVS